MTSCVVMAPGPISAAAGVISGRSGARAGHIGAEQLHLLAVQPVARQLREHVGVDIGVERLAELGEVDLVGEGVEVDEIERVAQRRAPHRRPDLGAHIRLAVAIDVDIDRRRARLGVGSDDLAFDGRNIGPGRIGLLSRVAVFLRRRPSGRSSRQRADFLEASGLAFEIGQHLWCPHLLDHLVRIERLRQPPPSIPRSASAGSCSQQGSPAASSVATSGRCAGFRHRRSSRSKPFRQTRQAESEPARAASGGCAQLVSAKVSSLAALSPLISTQSISCFSSAGPLPVLIQASACSTAICACA